MAVVYPTYPVTTLAQAEDMLVFTGNRIHDIMNADATSVIEVEDGQIPSIRKALVDNMYFKTPQIWVASTQITDPLQLKQFTDGGWYFAPTATVSTPVNLGATPIGDTNWKPWSKDQAAVYQHAKRLAAEAGYNMVSGSFYFGGTLDSVDDVLFYEGDGKYYSWSGAFPKVVPAGSTPATSGGVGAGAWVDRTQETLQLSLLSSSGASIVYTSTGETVEERLSSNELDIALKANTADVNAALSAKADINSTKKGGLTQSILANALTLNYAARLLQFRNSTLTNGTAVEVTPSAAMELTIPSGATLGGSSGIPLDIFVLGIYNGGSPVIGVVNAGGGLVLDESGLISTTAISATSTSASTIYTTSVVTNSPYVILASLTVKLPTAGAWSVLPTVIPTDLVSVGLLMKRVLYPAVATTSGTSIGFQIPLWTKKITVQFNGVSTSATSGLLLKMGVGGVAKSAAYSSSGHVYSNIFLAPIAGFYAGYRGAAAGTVGGAITLTKQSDLSWTAQGYTHSDNGGSCGGSCTLTGVADSLFLTTINGSDTFDAGSVSLLIEG